MVSSDMIKNFVLRWNIEVTFEETRAHLGAELASWYDKQGALTFSDIMAFLRRSIWSNIYFSKSENQPDFDKFSEATIESLIYQL